VSSGSAVSEHDLVRFVLREARLLDEQRYEEWLALFTDDGHYWVPLGRDQTDPILHASLAYEDALLRKLRVERLRSPRAFAQQPPSHSHHLLQTPEVKRMDAASNEFVTRTQFLYTEAQGDAQIQLAGTVFHTLTVVEGSLRLRLKRVNLLNCDAALPSIQLFP
jgi:3-phenylpropionate/cinnamic acid dioxygenase small subunit